MDTENSSNERREKLFQKLSNIAKRGPIPAIMTGDTAIGMTLLDALGIDYTSSAKPKFEGIVVTARRRAPTGRGNRVNLFAQVPDWDLSTCKSSREIVQKHGYKTGSNKRRLYCTVSARSANSHGLVLEINNREGLVEEISQASGVREPVAVWNIKKLQDRLLQARPESVWVKAVVFKRDGQEFFHYREGLYTGPPKVAIFSTLLDAGTITIDHLIDLEGNRAREKGPFFKIHPSNLDLLFPSPQKYDLLTLA
jgi:hypothetical protein